MQKKSQEKIAPRKKCFKKCPSKRITIPKKNFLNKNLLQKMPPRKKPTGQMPPRKSPGKIPPTYNAFWKIIPLEKYPLVKCQPGKKAS